MGHKFISRGQKGAFERLRNAAAVSKRFTRANFIQRDRLIVSRSLIKGFLPLMQLFIIDIISQLPRREISRKVAQEFSMRFNKFYPDARALIIQACCIINGFIK